MSADLVKDNPNKPYKAYAGIVAAVLSSLLAQYADAIPPVGKLIISALIAGIAVYVTPNPKMLEDNVRNPIARHRGEAGHGYGNTVILILAIVGIVLLVLLLVGAVNVH